MREEQVKKIGGSVGEKEGKSGSERETGRKRKEGKEIREGGKKRRLRRQEGSKGEESRVGKKNRVRVKKMIKRRVKREEDGLLLEKGESVKGREKGRKRRGE